MKSQLAVRNVSMRILRTISRNATYNPLWSGARVGIRVWQVSSVVGGVHDDVLDITMSSDCGYSKSSGNECREI